MRLSPTTSPWHLDEEGTLFRVLMLVFVPTFIGGALATRAYALPMVSENLDESAHYIDAGIQAIPRIRIDIELERHDPQPPLEHTTALSHTDRRGGAPHPQPSDTGSSAPASRHDLALAAIGSLAGSVESQLGEELDQTTAALENVNPDLRFANRVRGRERSDGSARPDVEVPDSGDGGGSPGAIGPLGENGPPLSIVRAKLHDEVSPGHPIAGSVGDVVRGYRGSVETCVQTAMKQDPTLDGRLALAWRVANGKATAIRVLDNDTASPDLARCLSRAVGRMHFDPAEEVEVDSYAWVVGGN